ncbi:hypothetical protein HMI55_003226, partial [Coelomomyces lativittatus]
MDNKTFYVKYLNNQPVPIDTHYNGDQKRSRPLSTVAHLVAAMKTAVTPRFDSTPTDELTLHLPEGIERSVLEENCFATFIDNTTLRTGLSLSKLLFLCLDDLHPFIIKSSKDCVHQKASLVSIERPITPEEEKHLQWLLSYVFKTESGRCVTVFDEYTAVTHAHGSHSSLKEGDTIQISPVNEENFIQVTIKEINKARDYTLLHSETPLCKKRLTLKVPRIGIEYIQIGLSGIKESPVIYNKGVISSDDFQNNEGFMIGSSGSSPGDSGCGIFHTSALVLYGIGTACLKRVHTDFRRENWEHDIGCALNNLTLVASQPV